MNVSTLSVQSMPLGLKQCVAEPQDLLESLREALNESKAEEKNKVQNTNGGKAL